MNDVRFVKDGVARALRTLRHESGAADRVVRLSAQMIGLRFTAAARAAGVESRVTAHSGRVGLASELTNARRELEDEPDGGALLRRGHRGTRCRRTLPVTGKASFPDAGTGSLQLDMIRRHSDFRRLDPPPGDVAGIAPNRRGTARHPYRPLGSRPRGRSPRSPCRSY